jgi:AcrR family transcriptional regulator
MTGNRRISDQPSRQFSQDSRAEARMARQAQAVQRILAGALHAATQCGVDSLSMSEIAAAAGVSERTVYRYFSSRDAVVTCMGERVRRRWELVLDEAVRAAPKEEHRVRVVLQSITRMSELIPESRTIFDNDPVYALAFLKQHFPDFIDAIVRAMAPVLDTAAAVDGGMLSERDAAEILLRIALADFLVPLNRDNTLSEQVDAFWSFVGGRVPRRDLPRLPRARVHAVRVVSDLALG